MQLDPLRLFWGAAPIGPSKSRLRFCKINRLRPLAAYFVAGMIQVLLRADPEIRRLRRWAVQLIGHSFLALMQVLTLNSSFGTMLVPGQLSRRVGT